MPAAMLCTIRRGKYGETCSSSGIRKTKYACIVEADESTRKRLEETQRENHEDHIAGKGINLLNHYNLVHKFIPVRRAMKIPEARGAVDKEWENLSKIPAWQLTKVRSKKDETEKFASSMDLCHLKNSELEPQFQKYKGRVVLRGDIAKDVSGSYAVFTEQGSSASQMTAAKRNGCHIKATRMRRTSSRRSISLHPSQNARCTDVIENSQLRVSRHLDTSTTTQVAEIMVQH